MPQKLTGSITASFRYSRLIFLSAITSTSDQRNANGEFANKKILRLRLARRRRQRGRFSFASAEQSHLPLVVEQLVLQLHVHRLALDLLHLRVHARRAELEFRLGGRGAPVNLLAHLRSV